MYDVVLYCILSLVNLETTGNHKKELLYSSSTSWEATRRSEGIYPSSKELTSTSTGNIYDTNPNFYALLYGKSLLKNTIHQLHQP